MPVRFTTNPAHAEQFNELLAETRSVRPPMMLSSQLRDARNKFDQCLTLDGTKSLYDEDQSFLFSELEAKVDTLGSAAANQKRFVIFYMGLNGRYVRYGLGVIMGTQNGTGYSFAQPVPDQPTWILTDSDFIFPDPANEWSGYRQQYIDHVHIQREDGATPEPYDENRDAKAIIFPWEDEIEAMFKTTTSGIGDSFRIMLTSVSVYHEAPTTDGGPTGYRHGLALFVQRKELIGWSSMVDEDDTGSIYHYKAADYGNMCPPKCPRYDAGHW